IQMLRIEPRHQVRPTRRARDDVDSLQRLQLLEPLHDAEPERRSTRSAPGEREAQSRRRVGAAFVELPLVGSVPGDGFLVVTLRVVVVAVAVVAKSRDVLMRVVELGTPQPRRKTKATSAVRLVIWVALIAQDGPDTRQRDSARLVQQNGQGV